MSSTPPWEDPPQRAKTLRQRKAERAARRAAHWGRLLQEARADGPEAVAAVEFDRARAALDRLRQDKRDRAYEALAEAVDQIRMTHAE